MSLAEGAYKIISAAGTGFVWDVAGMSENKGANLQMWTDRNKVSQMFAATLNDDGTYNLINPLSGRAVSIKDNRMAAGTNVLMWGTTGAHSQAFNITEDGKTVTIGGTSYPTYSVLASSNNGFAVASAKTPANSVNVQLAAADGSDTQRWAFVPANIFSDSIGTYRIISALDETEVASVVGLSKGANIQLETYHGDKEQGWKVMPNTDGTMALMNTYSKMVINVAKSQAKSGANAEQWAWKHNEFQSFVISPSGDMPVDGQNVPTYIIRLKAGTNLALCVNNETDKASTDIHFWTENDNASQKWAFVPVCVEEAGIDTPAGLACDLTDGANGLAEIPVTFSCDATTYQVRGRFRSRKAGSNTFGAWSSWKALDGVAGNDGWGDAWSANLTFDDTADDDKSFAFTIPEDYIVDGTKIAATDAQIELRVFEPEFTSYWTENDGATYPLTYTAHGPSVGLELEMRWKPTATVTKAELCGEGLRVYYTSDLKDGGCTIDVTADGISGKATGKYGGSGYVLIPAAKWADIPSGTMTCTAVVTKDIASDEASADLTVVDADKRLHNDATVTATDYGTYFIKVAIGGGYGKKDTYEMYEHIGGSHAKLTEREKTSTSITYECVPPLNSDGYILFWEQRVTGTWLAKRVDIPVDDSHAFVWVWSDGTAEGTGGAVLDLNRSNPPKQEDSVSRSVEDYETTGREYHAYRLGKSKERTLNASGCIVPDLPHHGTLDAFEKLLDVGHAVYRNPRGEVLNVCVTGISKPLECKQYTEITVTQKQESR